MDHEPNANLYSWFEKCGVISDVRTHLRQNLINALKNRDLDLKRDSTPKSAKQYIYDLLIAEYLFNHNYAYTLSVFASEAPLLMNFQNKNSSVSNEKLNGHKLQSDYVLHALETLGINPSSSKGRYIISQYVENDLPLLLCVLKCLSRPVITVQSNTEEGQHICNKGVQTDDPRYIYKKEFEKILTAKRRLLHQKKLIDNELQKREVMLKQQALVMDQQLACLNEKLKEVQDVMHSISVKEKEINERKHSDEQNMLQKQIELACKEKLLLQEANRKFEQDLGKLQQQLDRVQKEHSSKETFVMKSIEVQTQDIPDTNKNREVDILIKENEELNILVKDQKLRIDQITQRALQLSRQIEDIRLLKPCSSTPMKSVNAIVSESSSTEDILHDAKLRLRRLEEESLKADQYYYNFINMS